MPLAGHKTLILSVETSGRTGSVALAADEQILAEKDLSGLMRHSAELFPAICTLLAGLGRKPNDIEQVYISAGPGSFTGLRIAVALAKTMHLASGAKIVAVDTLDVIAANAACAADEERAQIERIAVILDAKRGQFYAAAYQLHPARNNDAPCVVHNTRYEKILPDCLMTAPQLLERLAGQDKPLWLMGEGLVYHQDKFKSDTVHFIDRRYWTPSAATVYLLGWKKALAGQFADPLTLQPTYLRRSEAEEKWQPTGS